VERRGQKHHRERLGEALREEIETLIEGELGDPRIGLARVTGVELADDARSARIRVAVEGSEKECERSLKGLAAATNWPSDCSCGARRSCSSSWTAPISTRPESMSC
jgi:ribosome-binding factor A